MCAETSLRLLKYQGQVFIFILPDPSERGVLQHYCHPTDITAAKEESSLKADELSEIQSMTSGSGPWNSKNKGEKIKLPSDLFQS